MSTRCLIVSGYRRAPRCSVAKRTDAKIRLHAVPNGIACSRKQSEAVTDAELHLTRRAEPDRTTDGRVQQAECAGVGVIRGTGRDLAKFVRQNRARVGEVRAVQEVERFRAEGHGLALRDPECAG